GEPRACRRTISGRTGGTACGAAGGDSDLAVAAPRPHVWHQLVGVQNGGSGQIYIDGVLVASATGMKPINNGNGYPVEIGRFGAYAGCGGGYYFNGLIDDVSVYSQPLTSTRVLAHYQAARYAQTSPQPIPDSHSGNVAPDHPIA